MCVKIILRVSWVYLFWTSLTRSLQPGLSMIHDQSMDGYVNLYFIRIELRKYNLIRDLYFYSFKFSINAQTSAVYLSLILKSNGISII